MNKRGLTSPFTVSCEHRHIPSVNSKRPITGYYIGMLAVIRAKLFPLKIVCAANDLEIKNVTYPKKQF